MKRGGYGAGDKTAAQLKPPPPAAVASASFPHVVGNCPMGCGPHLLLMDDGHINCAWGSCPRPDAASLLLEDRETEHVVLFGRAGFTIRHPLRERLDDALMTCDLHTWCIELDGPLDVSGPVRMRENGTGGWEVIW